jgi:hypothetical protein
MPPPAIATGRELRGVGMLEARRYAPEHLRVTEMV